MDLTTRMRGTFFCISQNSYPLDERMNRVKAQVVQIEEGHETDEFWEALGGKGEISQTTGCVQYFERLIPVSDDEEWEKICFDDHKIYKINAAFGSKDYKVEEVDTQGLPFATSMLDPNFAFIIDFQQEMFVWYGRYAALVVCNNLFFFEISHASNHNPFKSPTHPIRFPNLILGQVCYCQ